MLPFDGPTVSRSLTCSVCDNPQVLGPHSRNISGMFRRSASLAIPHHKSFAAIPSLSLGSLGTRIAALNCHTNRSVKLPLFRHFQDQFLTTNKEKWGKKTGLCFARLVFLTFRGPLASHDSNPYPKCSGIARYNATKATHMNMHNAAKHEVPFVLLHLCALESCHFV